MENPNSSYDNLSPDLVRKNELFLFTRPDLYIFTFWANELCDTLEIKSETRDMSVFVAWAYSVDEGTSWSRYYLDDIEHEKFIQLIRDAFAKQMLVQVKCRLETKLTKEDSFETSNVEEPYYVRILNVWFNNKPIEIITQYVINATGITLPHKQQLWNPYANMDAAESINAQASLAINHMFGHWVYYFKTEPDEDTKNVTLKSYTLHNVVSMKKIKVSVPNNNFPDSRNIYSEWGIQLPDEFKIHILNDTFQRAFGPDSYPHSHDYLYFPLTGIMYEVNSFFENKNFMYRPLWNEVIVVRYEDDKIVQKNEFEEDTFDYVELTEPGGLTVEEAIESQEADPNYLNMDLLEYFRLKMHKQTEIVNFELVCNRLKLFDNMYLFAAVPQDSIGVSFDCKKTLLDNISINFWFMMEKVTPTRVIWQCLDTNSEMILKLHIDKGMLKLTYKNKVLWGNIDIKPGIRYACSVSLSIMYQYMEMFIYGFDEETGVLSKLLDNPKMDIPTSAYGIAEFQIMGGKHLISNIGMDSVTYNQDEVKKRLTLVTPESKTNVFFDKAAVPITEDKINGY